MKVWWRENKPK